MEVTKKQSDTTMSMANWSLFRTRPTLCEKKGDMRVRTERTTRRYPQQMIWCVSTHFVHQIGDEYSGHKEKYIPQTKH